jgi:SpoVK/Ycf46/Vps4 family AAA+-type ATPase
VLFVDEAYALIERDDDTYGKEAVSTLVKLMEDMRDEFVCILAGYTEDMNAMLDVNPGLRDRIQFHIEFPDYDLSELMQIFELFCKENGYELSDSAAVMLKSGMARILATKPQNFSNGRLVRKLFERVQIKQAVRASDNAITEHDIREAFSENDITALLGTSRMAIGFQLSA